MAYTKRQQREWHNNFKAAYQTSELETIPGKEVVTIERLADDSSTRSRPYEDENAPEIAFLLEGDGLRRAGKHEFARDRYNLCLDALTRRAQRPAARPGGRGIISKVHAAHRRDVF